MYKQLLAILIICASCALAESSFHSAKVDFLLPCEGPLCRDDEVASLMNQVQDLIDGSTYLIQVWSHEVTLLICSTSSPVLHTLAPLTASKAFDGAILEVRFGGPCVLYDSK